MQMIVANTRIRLVHPHSVHAMCVCSLGEVLSMDSKLWTRCNPHCAQGARTWHVTHPAFPHEPWRQPSPTFPPRRSDVAEADRAPAAPPGGPAGGALLGAGGAARHALHRPRAAVGATGGAPSGGDARAARAQDAPPVQRLPTLPLAQTQGQGHPGLQTGESKSAR